ncbi:hypothetical protein AVEN_52761-1 [Araneus ventricosus]|uniref:Uncharacterized protein n=1 Tax=Araneus ventricosus TaxID=182803 RepID=A0A4Y2CW61_ARAVE|nr:hypothetical protein AVEN_52761-1 [Araneus ventricosus]
MRGKALIDKRAASYFMTKARCTKRKHPISCVFSVCNKNKRSVLIVSKVLFSRMRKRSTLWERRVIKREPSFAEKSEACDYIFRVICREEVSCLNNRYSAALVSNDLNPTHFLSID